MNSVYTQTIGLSDAWLLRARQHHLVAGPTAARGGDESTWKAAELLLGALASCATAIIADAAAAQNIPLRNLRIEAESERDPDDKTRYRFIRVRVHATGPSWREAETLVGTFQQECPIYGTLSRGAPVHFDIHVSEA
jgi:uncharacterized OsmC-like protein